jgi:uncharacterized protein (TIGR03437 family)
MNCAIEEIVGRIRRWNETCLRERTPRMLPLLLLLSLGSGLIGWSPRSVRGASTIQNSYPVTSVSAASYVGPPGALAPNSIVAAFGTRLASGTAAAAALPLPTSLLSTQVLINNIPAPLFFVSPNQINYLIPETVPAGSAEVIITSTIENGDQIISRGELQIAPTGPALFTADASGSGAPAALTGRVDQNNAFTLDFNPPYHPDPANPGRLIPAPIDVGTTERPAFLILFGTGIRNASPEAIRALIGGVELPVAYYGPAGDYAGLDQINLQLPTSLRGRGLVDVTIVINGVSSNVVSIDLAGTGGQNLVISGFGVTTPALAGQTVTIRGTGFSATPEENLVRFGPAQARVIAATANQLTVIVPFGAQSGQVTVQSNQVEARSNEVFKVKTSISGIIQSTGGLLSPPAPLSNVTVRLAGTNISVRTTPQGTFVLSEIPPGVSLVEVDGGTTNSSPPFPSVTLKLAARADRDNQISQPISLQQINGGSASVGGAIGSSGYSLLNQLHGLLRETLNRDKPTSGISLKSGRLDQAQFSPFAKSITITNRGVTLEVPFGTSARFPDGKSGGQIQLTVLEGTRLPGITIPAGINTATIAQITPIGTRFQPGASLTFPNPDQNRLRPGDRATLYRYDPATGGFIKRGTGTVSADGGTIVSDGRVVDVATFWMVATAARVTTVTGRVIDNQGRPVSGAKVMVNSRASLSDQNGGFSIPEVAASADGRVQAEAIVPQQFGTPPRGLSATTTMVTGGITNVGTIALSNTRQAGLVLSPFAIDLPPNAGPVTVNITLTQPAPGTGLNISLTTDDTSVITVPGGVTIPAGQTTTSFNVNRVGAGAALIEARATLGGAQIETSAVVSVSLPGPILTSISPGSVPVGGRLTISGSGLSVVPNNHFVSFIRNNQLLALLNPFETEVTLDANGKPALRVRVPALSPGAVAVVVAVIDPISGIISENSSPLNLNVTQSTLEAPLLTATFPAQGKPRDQIRINGSGFSSLREENQVRFIPSGQAGQSGQSGLSIDGQILEATPTSLLVAIPALGISRGDLTIIARRVEGSGASSGDSNAINFNVTADPPAPSTPVLTTVANVASGSPVGKDGDRIRASGRDFGSSFFSLQTGLNAVDPIVTLVIFTQNDEFVNYTVPVNASGGNQIEAVVPSGLRKGTAAVTVFNFDTETGLISEESTPVGFTISEGSDFRLDEGEPNDSPDLATKVFFPSRVEGRITTGDAGSLTIVFNPNEKIVLSDLFSLTLDQVLRGTISLTFSNQGSQGADLDLFVLRKNGSGRYEVLASSTSQEGTIESLTGDLPPGEYLIGIGAFKGSTPYLLSLQYATGQAAAGRTPMLMKWGEVVDGPDDQRPRQ